ncbi:MAG: general secretion pathway protein GspB [Desulfuromonas sp.]|nr:general secretion pathway protein GspB [Desulfuromonas sp.]
MSFILEALKKSEKARQQTGAPDINTQHHNQPQPTKKKPLLTGLLLTLLGINAVILIWLFGPWAQQDAPVDTEVAIVETQRVEPTNLPPVQPTKLAEAVAIPASTTTAANTTSSASVVSDVTTESPQNQTTQPIQATTANTAKAQTPITQPEIGRVTATLPKILDIDELPPQLQQQAHKLHMSVHSYTGDSNSLIRLNNKIMYEGSSLDNNYYLEQITADGAILSYQGYTFKILRTGY